MDPQKPNIAAVGGMGTENGSWAAFGAHSGSWFDGQLETLVGALYGSINLDFYGIGDSALNNNPVGYRLQPMGGIAEGRYRIGRSPVRAGLGYVIASTKASFDGPLLPPAIQRSTSSLAAHGFGHELAQLCAACVSTQRTAW